MMYDSGLLRAQGEVEKCFLRNFDFGHFFGCKPLIKRQLFVQHTRGTAWDSGTRRMTVELIENYKMDALRAFGDYRDLAERALLQVSDGDFFRQIDPESNSLAIIVKHISGNLHSRWRDFLTSDGEKADRHRDSEFELADETRESLMQFWKTGWQTLFENIEPLTVDDFSRTITIRGEPHTVVEAINRQLTHYAMHIGQIVFLAKHLKGSDWATLSVPRNHSADFNRFLAEKQAAGETASTRYDSVREYLEK